jgi:hypothetical protein
MLFVLNIFSISFLFFHSPIVLAVGEMHNRKKFTIFIKKLIKLKLR